MSAVSNGLKQTALHEIHADLGARMGAFAGYEMPLWYKGIKEEHLCVRSAVGIFDLSHMGEIFIRGRQAFDLVQHLTSNDLRRIGDGQCQYSPFPTPEGGVVDDMIAYQISPEEYMLVVNASNIDKDFAWINKHNKFECEVVNSSDEKSLVAVQGPKTDDLLKAFGLKTIKSQKPFTFRRTKLQGKRITVAGTGYTGERGFELIVDNADAVWLWESLMKAGEEFGVQPIGLGARDTLRLEMGYSLYGHELTDEISVLEANLAWTVRFGPDFLGRDFMLKQKEEGLKRLVTGVIMEDKKGAPRHSAPVYSKDGKEIGVVTSGSFSPSLETGIGMVMVPPEFAEEGKTVLIDVRGKRVAARVVNVPFYKKQ